MSPEQLQEFFESVGARWVRDLKLRVTRVDRGDVSFELDVRPERVHGGGVLCGQATMAAFDTGMVFVMASLHPERQFTTVTLNSSFERPVGEDAGTVTFEARATKTGRTMVFGQVDCLLPNGTRAASATATYVWL